MRAAPPSARILIVEDEWLIASECEYLLTAGGHEVVGVASDEKEAVALAESTRPDLVLMDIRLARGDDGVEVAKTIRRCMGIGCIFVSAHNDAGTKQRGEAAKPLGWLSKPYSGAALLSAVSAACSKGRH